MKDNLLHADALIALVVFFWQKRGHFVSKILDLCSEHAA